MPYPIGNVAFSKSKNVVIWRYDVINGAKMMMFCNFSLVIANFTHFDHFKDINNM